MDGCRLFWGDLHFHFPPPREFPEDCAEHDPAGWEGFIDDCLRQARGHVDFLGALFYPAYNYRSPGPDGYPIESVGMKDGYEENWAAIQRIAEAHHAPGERVTFPGYEWTGDRTRWGDHNVIYKAPGGPLDLSADVRDLFRALGEHEALAIPHHTGYEVGHRGKDWSAHDPRLSPVVEIYSGHGCSESIDAPADMRRNGTMSPRVSGGTARDGLARGRRFGFIASPDSCGFPAKWDFGVAGVWAEDLTRDALWGAIARRRTYAVTGDRMRLTFQANGRPMGEAFPCDGEVELTGEVVGSDEIDRVELIRDGRVIDAQCCLPSCPALPGGPTARVKLRIEVGWGPSTREVPGLGERRWSGSLRLSDGRLLGVETCFSRAGQWAGIEGAELRWEMATAQREREASGSCQQALVVEIDAPPDAPLFVECDGMMLRTSLRELASGSRVLADVEGAERLLRERFGAIEFEDPAGSLRSNAYKLLLHRAVPAEACRVAFHFKDRPEGRAYYYVRVSQRNGQQAWASPVWVDR